MGSREAVTRKGKGVAVEGIEGHGGGVWKREFGCGEKMGKVDGGCSCEHSHNEVL